MPNAPLVGLVGLAQAGKDTFAGYLRYDRIAFADALKMMALELNPRIGIRGLTNLVATHGWEVAKSDFPGVREYLQDLGLVCRGTFGDDCWVKAAFQDWSGLRPTVVTDVRFQNEVDEIRFLDGVIVRIKRGGQISMDSHVSELLAVNIEPDFEVYADDGDLAALALQAGELRKKLT